MIAHSVRVLRIAPVRVKEARLPVVQNRKPDVDGYLDYLLDAWGRVPDVARGWDTLDHFEQEMFHLEWLGVTESRLRELERWQKQNAFTPAQQSRYEELYRLVARVRPVLGGLFADFA